MLFLIIFAVVAIVLLFRFLRQWTWESKGDRGEHYVANILASLNENEYKVLNDVMLRTKDGKTSQIDHVVVSNYGIFVIETKNYSGWIFGNEKAENWMQSIYVRGYYSRRYRVSLKGRVEKNQFRNPVKQNWSHIYVLKDLLAEYKNIPYFPIVVFVGSAGLKEIESSVPVIYGNQLLSVIHSKSTAKCLSDTDVQKITDMLLNKNIGSDETKAEHIQNIRQDVLERKLKMENLICPRCNGELKLREGRTGKFYGCSNYPHCRFTMPY